MRRMINNDGEDEEDEVYENRGEIGQRVTNAQKRRGKKL